MTEQARLYGTVLYELKLPETMIRTCECILRENPQLAQVLESPSIRQRQEWKPSLDPGALRIPGTFPGIIAEIF